MAPILRSLQPEKLHSSLAEFGIAESFRDGHHVLEVGDPDSDDRQAIRQVYYPLNGLSLPLRLTAWIHERLPR
jgi:hypothetical protein